MAKKTNKKMNKTAKIILDDNLPQNIISMGERVEECKNIYISQSAYKEIQEFTVNKTTNESGGMLIGNVINEFGKMNVVIHGFVEAKYCEATPTTLKFTHETWDYVHSEIEKKYENAQIVGWIHTHPNFGIFLSEYDKFIQENFFREEHQIAYVVDPIQHIEGFYFWINGNIEKCKGFYIFDKNGEKIEIKEHEEQETDEKSITVKQGSSAFTFGLAVILCFLVIIFSVMCINMNNRMKSIENQQNNLNNNANQNIMYLQQQILSLQQEIDSLRHELEVSKETETKTDESETKTKEDETETTGSETENNKKNIIEEVSNDE